MKKSIVRASIDCLITWVKAAHVLFASSIGLAAAPLVIAASAIPLWHVGQSDQGNTEFALAPRNYSQFSEDGCFVVGLSDTKQDWPYVHPGPLDDWAGRRSHSFSILFALKSNPSPGECHLRVDLLDTHASSPPKLQIEINRKRFEKDLPPGAGDASIFGDPARGREFIWDLAFPAGLLRVGENEITITTLSGSWILYDSIGLETPPGAELSSVAPRTSLIGVDVPPVWINDEGRSMQPLTVRLRHIGHETDARICLGTNNPSIIHLSHGLKSIELKTRAAEQSVSLPLSATIDGHQILSTNLVLHPPRIRELWALPHSHVDVGYTHRQEDIVKVQIANLEKSIALSRASASNPPGMRFKWNPEAVWSLDHFLDRSTPSARESFLEGVRQGDVGVDALFGNMLTALCRPEELVQCLSFGTRLSGLAGVPVESAAICDVPGWTWGLVPVMAQAGVKYFAIGPNYSARVGTIHQWDNKPFYWQSQSGLDRVFCWVVDNYHHFGKLDDHVIAHVSKLDQATFPYDTSFLFWVGVWPNGGVDNAPPDEKLVDQVVAWNARFSAPRLCIGLATEFFRSFESRFGAQVPTFRGDLTPYWEDGAGSTARETALNRASADRLSQADTLFAMRNPSERPNARFDAAWKNVLLYSEHTWGAYNSIDDPDNPFVKDQWAVKQAFALDADQQSRALLDSALTAAPFRAAQDLSLRPSIAIDVYNTTQWERTDLAHVPAHLAGSAVLDDRGRYVPSQRLASGELVFLASQVPPFGAKRFCLTPQTNPLKGHARADGNLLRTRSLAVELDQQSGAIKSLRIEGLSHEFVDFQSPSALNDYRYVLGPDAKGARSNGKPRFQVLETGPWVASIRVESDAPGCNRLIREVRVVDGLDRVELINHVDRQSVRVKDSVHFGFGFNVPGGTLRMETPWAVIRPNLDQLPGSCRNWFTVQRWVDISNPEVGITWAPLDAPLMEIGGLTANLMGPVQYEEWMNYAFESCTIYSWAQNNHWFTNYKIDQPGVTTFRYYLRPHRHSYRAADAARFGVETTRPLIAAAAEAQQPVLGSLLRISNPNVLVETVKPSQDGSALIIRLFGVSGTPQSIDLAWPGMKPTAIWTTDLSEKPLQKIQHAIRVPAFGVVILRAEIR